MIHARFDPELRATVTSRTPLLYDEGPAPTLDRPAHVRAGSGLAWSGERLVVVQDDASFLAVVDPRSLRVSSVTLPPGEGGVRQFDERRGNKKAKLDLESAVVLGEWLVAFGSGSSPRRERVVVARATDLDEVRLVDAASLYALLRAETAFAGSELNVEGATRDGRDVLLFQRGNGAPRDGRAPVDATCRLDAEELLAFLNGRRAPPRPRDVTPYDLGRVNGVRLTFTDAAARTDVAARARVFYLASAEASPNAVDDGPVVGVALGVLAPGEARQCLLRDAAGAPFTAKAEGLAFKDARRALLVLDLDDPDAPSELCEVELEGTW